MSDHKEETRLALPPEALPASAAFPHQAALDPCVGCRWAEVLGPYFCRTTALPFQTKSVYASLEKDREVSVSPRIPTDEAN